MRTKALLLIYFFTSFLPVFSQDDKWETQKQITGYLSFEGNYFSNLKFFDREDFAISMPEAGILFSYQPLNKLNFKGVLVYRPLTELRNMFSEISAEWEENRFLKIKIGHQLTPLSPINTSFYAPVNTGIVMPMIVSHHDYYPTNIEAISIAGSVGEQFKINYCVLGGGYYPAYLIRSGPMNFFGGEDSYFYAILNDTIPDDETARAVNTGDLYYGFGGHLRFAYGDYAMIGINSFSARSIFSVPSSSGGTRVIYYAKQAYGINFNFQFNTAKLIGEAWTVATRDRDHFDFGGRNGFYVELSNSFHQLTPYVKYEYKHLNRKFYTRSQILYDYTRYIVGINYKPIYEATLKLEYFAYDTDHLKGFLMAIVFAF